MNSPKVKTQKTLSAILAAALAIVTLFQAAAANSYEAAPATALEAELLAEFDQFIAEEVMGEEMEEIESFEIMELEAIKSVKVYNQNNELIGEGNPEVNPLLGKLVNQADYLSQIGGDRYYKISE